MGEQSQAGEAEECLEIAYYFKERHRPERALEECDSAIKIAEALLAEIFNLRGVVLEDLGRKQEAIAAYTTATRLDPDLSEAADNLFDLERELGRGRDLVTVAWCDFAVQAHAARARLEAEGIQAFVVDEGIVTANWLYLRTVGRVKVKVREGDAQRALDALETKATEEDEELRCPECGSSNIRFERFHTQAVFASWLLLGVPLPFLNPRWKCRECHHEWKEPDEPR